MNTYVVKIGRYTRAGNFESLNEFCCDTEMNDLEITRYMKKKYCGFSVEIDTPLFIEVPKETPEEFKSKSIFENEPAKKEPPKNYKMVGSDRKKIPAEILSFFEEVKDSRKEYNKKEETLTRQLRAYLEESPFVYSASIKNIDYLGCWFSYTAQLNYESIVREIEEN